MYTVTIPGKPKAMDRPRVTISGFRATGGKIRNFNWNPDKPPKPVGARVYTPKGTLEYERLVAEMAIGQGVRRIEGPVGVEADLYICAPNRRAAGDGDNILKCLLDGLKGVAYEDDSFVDYMVVRKFYIRNRSEQKAVLRIGRLEEFDLPEAPQDDEGAPA